mgnify:CR=1 FL=1
MNTEKPGGPFYQLSVEETLTSTNSTPEGISGAEAVSYTHLTLPTILLV